MKFHVQIFLPTFIYTVIAFTVYFFIYVHMLRTMSKKQITVRRKIALET